MVRFRSQKHDNYELLNLIGYGLAKFDNNLIKEFGFSTKQSFFDYFVSLGIVETSSVVKNRMDLFDPYFDNGRKGWWQKADVYRHRKTLIDSLFGDEDAKDYANIIKLFLYEKHDIKESFEKIKPITKTRFKKLQETGFEAEQYFISNFDKIDNLKNGTITDARLYDDGYDFQIEVSGNTLLVEVKGIRSTKGKFRLTENEYKKADEYKSDYFIALVMDLDNNPTFKVLNDPIKNLEFKEKNIAPKQIKEFHLLYDISLK